MPETSEYAGRLEVADGKLLLPKKYAQARHFVVRQRTITQDIRRGDVIDRVGWRDSEGRGVQNEHVAADEVQLKVYGEPEERYEVAVDE